MAPKSGVHICLRARTTGEVDAFHAEALSVGGASAGAEHPPARPRALLRRLCRRSRGNRIETATFPAEQS